MATTRAALPASSAGYTAALALVAILVVAGAAVGAYQLLETDSAVAPTSAPVAVPLPVLATAAPTLVPTPTAAPTSPKTVRVGILPVDALVDVDGETVVVKDGAIAIAGGLGTVHRVHISKGADQVTEDVAVTQQGAVPAKLELKASVAKPGKAK